MWGASVLSIPPATDVPVLVPWRSDNGPREQIWRRLRADAWAGWRVVVGEHLDGPFNISAARNRAAQLAGDWECAVLADADSIVPPQRLHAAITLARDAQRLVICHDRWVNIAPDEHDAFLRSWSLPWRDGREIYPMTVSSMLAVPRTVWDELGGYDQRMAGYGYEDNAFVRAARVLTGEPLRLVGSVYHLSHTADRPHFREHLRTVETQRNRALWQRYQQAVTPEQMRALLAEQPAT
jgi:hypothetical protein